ncbi:MAG: hypothetical protein JXR70_17240 [Spirochaetales bacterium]|nr:hypothetical protein [Spirochaetales bacterium]
MIKIDYNAIMKCHITSTLGPAILDSYVLQQVIEKSDRLRINTAFTSAADLSALLNRIEKIAASLGKLIPLVLDLQGAKMRIGRYPEAILEPGVYSLLLAEESTDYREIPVPHPRLFQALQPGDRLLLNDRRVQTRVLSVQPLGASIEVEKGGPLSSYKGINRVDHPIAFSGLEDRDKELILATGTRANVELAYSFVFTGDEALSLKDLSHARLIAKIERPEALDHLVQISQAFDELWFCRGDMGAQAGLQRLGPIQQCFIERTREYELPVILAGQVLEHMSHFPEPTRAEVVQLYDALKAGFTGIVLSDETAVGKNPLAVLDFLDGVKIW